MSSQHIFMTGASGYIGSVITEFAIAEGYTVTGLSRSPASDEKLRALSAIPVRGDLKSYDVLTQESAKADIVIHLVDSIVDDFSQDYSNVVKTDKAAVDAIAAGLAGSNKRLLVTSGSLTSAADPTGALTSESSPLWPKPLKDRIKSETHALAQAEKGIRVTALRLAPWVYGRGGSGVKLFMAMAATRGEVVYVGSGEARITTVHVHDAARLYLLAAKGGKEGVYNATSETDVTFKQLAEAMGKVLGLDVKGKEFDEVKATAGEFFAKFLSVENRASNEKARKEFGWEPKERGILEEIEKGSYVEVAKGLRGGKA